VVKINGAALNKSVFNYDLEASSNLPLVDIVRQDPAILEMGRFDKGKLVVKAANLTSISWAHAVNSQQLLAEALSGKN